MKTDRCTALCQPDANLHEINHGELRLAGIPCAGCGGTSKPHYGYAYPCSASANGAHYFTAIQAETNARG